MALLIRGEIPATADQYDQINRQLGVSDGNLPEGLISHVAAGPTDGGGMEIVDVWESQQAFDAFIQNQLMPAVQALGFELQGQEPTVLEVHNMFTRR
jgi:hypothetical protein